MELFLKDVAKIIYKNHGTELDKCQIVVPSKRAGKFLQNHLQSFINVPIWSPHIYSISEFTASFCPFKIESSEILMAELYLSCSTIEKGNWETFEKFMKWGQLMLSDFNEIDSYLIDPELFFSDLKNIKDIENWSLNCTDLSQSQQELVDFWLKLGSYYTHFKDNLIKKEIGYSGMASRYLAENIADLYQNINYDKIYFVGFNALSKSEQTTITYLTQKNKAEIIWDIDKYYYNDDLNEAGLFFRRYKGLVKNNLYDLLSTSQKDFEIIGVPQNIGQADVAYSIVNSLPKESLNKTLVALADESQIIPVLNANYNIVDSLNASMGYGIKWSTLYDFLFNVLALVKNARLLSSQSKTIKLNLKEAQTLFNSIYVERFIKAEANSNAYTELIEKLRFYPNSMVEISDLVSKNSDNVLRKLFAKIISLIISKDNTIILLQELGEFIELITTPIAKNLTDPEEIFLSQINESIVQLKNTFEQYSFLNGIDVVINMLNKKLSSKSAPIIGDPMAGIQVMGMLETRALDFENVIMLSVNETIIPKARTDSSLIPYDIKRYYKLPTHVERDAIYANHFYRLMQRAKNIYLLYNTETDDYGSGEQSRFITQLCNELPRKNLKAKISKKVYSPFFTAKQSTSLSIAKNDDVVKKITALLEKGASPTMLSTYIKCPLDFYYKYILKLDKREIENQLSPPVLGTCIHNTLENVFMPYCNEIITNNHLLQIEKEAQKLYKIEVESALEKKFFTSGNNYMAYELGKIYLQKYFAFEKNFLKELNLKGSELTLISLEDELKKTIPVNVDNHEILVNLSGKIDRVDKVKDTLRVIDYKTGAVASQELSCESVIGLFQSKNSSKAKALQVLIYGYLAFHSKNNSQQNIEPLLISLKNIKPGFQGITINKKRLQNLPDYFDEFENGLSTIVSSMVDLNIPFAHNRDSTYCQFCNG